MSRAGELALENANPRSNPLRGSREYRLETLPVMVRRALEECRAQLV
jgi:carbon-monoxide dehydrogenase medium subunit